MLARHRAGKNNSLLPVIPTVEAKFRDGIQNRSFALKSGEEARYTIAIPKDYQPDQPAPLIVALHFGGKVTPHYARGIIESLVKPGLGKLNAIIVAPDSIAGPWTNKKNEEMVLELIDSINEQYRIDQNKTLLTGFSMGGHGTWYIGSRNQDRFVAMIPIAGVPMVEKDVIWTTPIYVLHSRADTVVPIKDAEQYVAAQQEQGNDQILLDAVENLAHFQTGSFSFPLRDAIPWVEKIWASESNNE